MTRKITKWTQGHLIKSHSNKETLGMKVKAVGCSWPDMILFAQFSFRNLLQLIKGLPLWLRQLRIWLQCRRPGSIPGSGRSSGEGRGYLLQYSWASLVAQVVKNPPAMQETWFDPWVGKIPWRRERLPTPLFWPGEFHGLYSSWGCKELDTTERFALSLNLLCDTHS